MKKFNIISLCTMIALGAVSALCITATVFLCIAGVSEDIYSEAQAKTQIGAELEATYDYGDGYIKSMVWVGDRTISPLKNHLDIAPSQLWLGEDGSLRLDYNLASTPVVASNDKKYSSIALAAEEIRPKYMLITVGLDNGVGYCTEEKFKEYYARLIDTVKEASPDTMIILQSVLPVSKAVEKESPSISNDRIGEVNHWICELGGELSVRYLNTHSALVDEKGYLKQEYDSGDGITLNASGYAAMLEYVRTHGYK